MKNTAAILLILSVVQSYGGALDDRAAAVPSSDVLRCMRMEIGRDGAAPSMVLEEKNGVPSIKMRDMSFTGPGGSWAVEVTASKLGGTRIRMIDPDTEKGALIELLIGRSPAAPLVRVLDDGGKPRFELIGCKVPGDTPSIRILDDDGKVLLSD